MGEKIGFLVSPYGQAGGGMGRIMNYLLDDQARAASPGLRLVPLDPCGAGGMRSWRPLGGAMLTLLRARLAGRLGLVHLNVAERGSLLRKGLLLLLCKLIGAPVILHLHAAQIIACHAALPAPARWATGCMFRAADRVVVLGGLWRDWAITRLGVLPERVVIVRNGVPDAALPHAEPTPDGPFRILFLGNLHERKGVADLLDALALLPDRGWQARFAGGGDVAGWRARATSCGIEARVSFTGWVDRDGAAQAMAAADLLVLPSHDEGLPLVILEALAAGVPVLCTPAGAIPEVLSHGRDALIVPMRNPVALAGTLMRAMSQPGMLAVLAAEGAALYRRAFTAEAFARSIRDLHAQVLEETASERYQREDENQKPVARLSGLPWMSRWFRSRDIV